MVSESLTAEAFIAYREAIAAWDLRTVVRNIRCPTLVLSSTNQGAEQAELSRELAADIQGSRLVTFSWTADDVMPSGTLRTIGRFLADGDKDDDRSSNVTVADGGLPEVRYVRTSDGVDIAYCTAGQGWPFVRIELPDSHVREEWSVPWIRDTYDIIAKGARLVRYDHRGLGLSGNEAPSFSLDAFVNDLEAVVDELHQHRFVLSANNGMAGQVAITYAIRHPERVSHMVLRRPYARMPEELRRRVLSLLQSQDDDWEFISEAFVRIAQGWDKHELSSRGASLLRQSVGLTGFRKLMNSFSEWDVADWLRDVRCPTLVIKPNQVGSVSLDESERVASGIPNARLVVLKATTLEEERREHDVAAAEFLGAPRAVAERPSARPAAGTAIIMFADIVDSTALTERMGDVAFRERARALDVQLRAIIREHAGRPIEGKLLGDGVLATFGAARDAIEAAVACGIAGAEGGLPLHLGVHAGDVLHETNNVFGGAVNLASRIAGLSAAGEVLVSDVVRALARTSAGVGFVDRGEHRLKGIGEPVRLYAVRTGSPDSATPVPAVSIERTAVLDTGERTSFGGGRYVVRGVLGEGGQKTVYLVHDTTLDRECALSLLRTELADAADMARLRHEARAMARLGAHTNIVTVHDMGEEGGRPYIVSEHVPGGDLRSELQAAGGVLPVRRALAIVTDVARALTVAHARGVVHRDIKPANVWLNADGSAKLGDFGIAVLTDSSRLTMTGAVLGSAAYMSPEQARGEALDGRSDLYALGCLLYELVVGRPPFVGSDPLAVVSQHVHAEPSPPRRENARVPKPVESLIMRLLEKNPGARPAGADSVVEELTRVGRELSQR
jgi:class 3 adenylate cyclase/pimeloyl-ACP methyl ester carboxylesterase